MASPKAGGAAGGGASLNGSKSPSAPIARTPSSHSMDQADRKPESSKQTPSGAQSRTAKSKGLQELRMKGMEREFKVKHLGLLAVLAWIL